jgi:hypothetical protein
MNKKPLKNVAAWKSTILEIREKNLEAIINGSEQSGSRVFEADSGKAD